MTQPYSFTNAPSDPPCARAGCHHDADEHEDEAGVWPGLCMVEGCDCAGYLDEPPEQDPDEIRDRRRFA